MEGSGLSENTVKHIFSGKAIARAIRAQLFIGEKCTDSKLAEKHYLK